MTNDQITELIKQRRLQVLVHSCVYYEFNESIVDDATWTKWAVELERLQAAYPDIAMQVEWAAEFNGFNHSTGYNLPLQNPWVVSKAIQLMRWHEERKDK